VTGIQRHLLDEAHLGAVIEREGDEVDELVVVDAAHGDRVELERAKARCGCRGDALHDIVEAVASGELAEAVAVERVDRDVEAVKPGTRSGSTSPRRMPFVVRATSTGPSGPAIAAIRRTTSTMSARSSGSPPVSRNVVIPDAAANRATRTISSVERMLVRASHSLPCSGMQ
jgi:hypothetical protein